MTTYTGNDNYGNPKQVYITKLSGMTDKELFDDCKEYIWLSAYASNNPRSDYHWKCDASYAECKRRGKTDIYERAHKRVRDSI